MQIQNQKDLCLAPTKKGPYNALSSPISHHEPQERGGTALLPPWQCLCRSQHVDQQNAEKTTASEETIVYFVYAFLVFQEHVRSAHDGLLGRYASLQLKHARPRLLHKTRWWIPSFLQKVHSIIQQSHVHGSCPNSQHIDRVNAPKLNNRSSKITCTERVIPRRAGSCRPFLFMYKYYFSSVLSCLQRLLLRCNLCIWRAPTEPSLDAVRAARVDFCLQLSMPTR